MGFFLAGTDTTANYTNMMVTYMGKYPEVQQKVREEVA
jgi:cytochrome P450